jgi:hypothetical protein
MATTLAQKKEITPLFSAEVYGARVAHALDALAALDACVRANLLCGLVATETVPFARPIRASCTRPTRSRGAPTTRTQAAWCTPYATRPTALRSRARSTRGSSAFLVG